MNSQKNFDFDPEDVKAAFRDWLCSLPFPPHDVNALNFDNEKKHRFRVADEAATKKSGEFQLHLNGFCPAGWAKSYRGDDFQKWKYAADRPPMTAEERKEFSEKCKAQTAEREMERAKEQQQGIKRARQIWETATPADACALDTYLFKKKLSSAHGVRQLGKDIIVPLYNTHGELVNVQIIQPNGDKKLQYAAPFQGNFFVIEGAGEYVFIGEGFSTCATIHETTGCSAICAFSCGNIASVIENVLPRFVGRLVIASDNDKTLGNPGVSAAMKAAERFGLHFVYPKFKDSEIGSDWNDYYSIHGLEATKNAIFGQMNGEGEETSSVNLRESPHWVDVHPKNGLPLPTIENLKALLSFYGIKVWFDLCKREKKYDLPSHLDNGSRFGIENRLNSVLALIRSFAEKQLYPTKNLDEALNVIADENRQHPVREWINSCVWDKKDRIGQFFDTIRVKNWFPEEFKKTLMLRWSISIIGATFSDRDFHSRGILVLQGNQGRGKSSWGKNLFPPSSSWFAEGATLDVDNRDSVNHCSSHLVVELADINLEKSDLAKLKAFITSSLNNLRLPWARESSCFYRRTIFFASVDHTDFLIDKSSNSRFWTLPCESINYTHGIDMLQFWRQIYEEYYLKGEQHWLTPDEEETLAKCNERFETADEVEEAILSAFDFSNYEDCYEKYGLGWLSTTEVLLQTRLQTLTNAQVKRGAKILKKLTNRDSEKKTNGARSFWMPNKRIN